MRSSWGCLQRMRPGVWRIRYRAGGRRLSETVRGTRREAEARLAELRVEHERTATPRAVTFARCWEWYLAEMQERLDEGSMRPSTAKAYESVWRNHVRDGIGGARMDGATPAEIQRWLSSMGREQARMSLVLVGELERCAAMRGRPTAGLKSVRYRMPRRREGRDERVYRLAEVERACAALEGTVAEIPAVLCGFGSCRVGEACGAMSADVRERRANGSRVAVVAIRGQLTPEGEYAPTKTSQSVRPVCVPDPWAGRVLEAASSGLPWLNDRGDGSPASRAAVWRAWKSAFEEGGALFGSGLPYLPLQRLRNSWETYMRWELGVDKDKLDKMMGHTSADVRSLHYDRPDEEVFAETVAGAFARRDDLGRGTS